MHYQWKYFIDLHNKRTSNGFGANPITWSEIYSYFKLIEYNPLEWELDLISKLDNVVLEIYAKKADAELKKSSKK